ncbi:MAG: energy transducer TonB [Gemmatimonadota bacterium]
MSQANEIGRAVAAQIRHMIGGPVDSIPDGATRMTWRALPALLTVTEFPDGRITRVVRGPPADTSASTLLLEAYDDVREAGGAKMPWPPGSSTDSVDVSVWLQDANVDTSGDVRDRDPGEPKFTAFTLMQPIVRFLGHSNNTKLRYPKENAHERIEGMVSVRFAVDTNGRVDLTSIYEVQAVDSRHPPDQSPAHLAFVQVVTEWIPKNEYSHYSVGRCGAAIVREQPVEFLIP